ncbi:MAG: aconitate hydratase AcnA [Candidatus Dormibacteraeota bacterium]|nr:aconitate hydratase AcnA [Candidatus Dormibacteraeota bacterium]
MDVRRRLDGTDLHLFSLEAGPAGSGRLPMTVKVLLEMLLRGEAAGVVDQASVRALGAWPAVPAEAAQVPYMPARVLLQDFTGVPAVVDLAAMRSAVERAGGDPSRVDPRIPCDLVIDHSVQVDQFGNARAYETNIEREYERNGERYALLRWAQQAFHNFTVVPPGMGICHQVNLEHLSRVVQVRDGVALPDTLVGTDSHTTMVNGLGVLGWGVGGIEAEACMLGQPMYLPPPIVLGVRFHNALPVGTTATDLVLTLTEMLRRHGVVGKFVEFCGDGLSSLTVADRATLSNMCPEYGATSALFPVDAQTLRYLETTGREPDHIALVERYCRAQGLYRTDGDAAPDFSELLELDLATIEPSLAGPKRPQDRVPLGRVWQSFAEVFKPDEEPDAEDLARFNGEGGAHTGGGTAVAERTAAGIRNGSVVIAAITSCTNTSNPSVMVAAGLLARNAVAAGLRVPNHVKTSLAPGSRVVTDYLGQAGLLAPLEKLGFYLVGYGCTTCIGNSGPLASAEVEAEVQAGDLSVAAVLSGNRNFEARIHPLVRASYLASPPLVVAYALAGTVRKDLTTEPLGEVDGRPVHLRDLWPEAEEVDRVVRESVHSDMFSREYGTIYDGDEHWRRMAAPTGAIYAWDASSTYVQEPPYFEGLEAEPVPVRDMEGARILVIVGDSVTTDHISPAGSIAAASPAGSYLLERGVERADFNSYGSRRGNHEVMMRGTFANIRLRNELAGGREGWWTKHQPSGEEMTIFDAAQRYRQEGVATVVIAGREYGSGSSRDWAAKGPDLLGVRCVIAESFERIHRSNLVGMGVLPLQFAPGETRRSLGLTGAESLTLRGLAAGLRPGQEVEVEVTTGDGASQRFRCTARVDNPTELEYLRHGGVLDMVLRGLIASP